MGWWERVDNEAISLRRSEQDRFETYFYLASTPPSGAFKVAPVFGPNF